MRERVEVEQVDTDVGGVDEGGQDLADELSGGVFPSVSTSRGTARRPPALEEFFS